MSLQLETGDSNDPNNQATSYVSKKRKSMKIRAEAWDHFTHFVDADGTKKAKCNYCGKVYYYDSNRNGSTSLNKHMILCKKLSLSGESKQTKLSLRSVGKSKIILKNGILIKKLLDIS